MANLPFALQVIIDLVPTKQSAHRMCVALRAYSRSFDWAASVRASACSWVSS